MAKSVLFVVLLAACGGSQTPAKPSAAQVQADDPTCPVTVAGTSVSAEDTADGAALVFVTTSDVAELRKRVGALAKSHNDRHAAMGPLPTGNEPGGGGHDHHDHAAMQATAPAQTGAMIGVHSKASAEDIQGGAKLVFVAFPDGVAKLQGELRVHAQHLASGSCKMDH